MITTLTRRARIEDERVDAFLDAIRATAPQPATPVQQPATPTQRRQLRSAAVVGGLTVALVAAGAGVASADPGQCVRHPDACEAPGATDHAPVLDRTITGTADATTCVLVWCW